MKRNCPFVPLSKQPLALVLIQVRFSPVAKIAGFIPEIQDFLRKTGYPVNPNQKNMILEIGPDGITQSEIPQWRFENPSHDSVVLIDQEQVLFQTVEYTNFEVFIHNFFTIFTFVIQVTESDKYGIITRLGLRYVDQIRKQTEDDKIELYLRPELRGMKCSEYTDYRQRYTISTIGKTSPANDFDGTLAIRITRGEQGLDLPPDLIAAAPAGRRRVLPEEDIALIDMDHYWNGSISPGWDLSRIEEMFFKMHDTIINGFHRSVVSEEGIEKWK